MVGRKEAQKAQETDGAGRLAAETQLNHRDTEAQRAKLEKSRRDSAHAAGQVADRIAREEFVFPVVCAAVDNPSRC